MTSSNDSDKAKSESGEYSFEDNPNKPQENAVPVSVCESTKKVASKFLIGAIIAAALLIGTVILLYSSDIFTWQSTPVISDQDQSEDSENSQTNNHNGITAEETSDVIEFVEVIQIFDDFHDGAFENVILINNDETAELKLETTKIEFEKNIIADNFVSARSVHAVDIDLDGDFDVLGAARYIHRIALWRNDGINVDTGKISFTEIIVDDEFQGAFSVHGADIDNDGYMDVIGASLYDELIAWWRNNQDGTFSERKIIDNYFDGAIFIYCADLDNNGFVDVLAAGEAVDQIAWWRNNGDGTFSECIVIGDNFTGARSVHTEDVDGDGDLDVLGTARFADKVVWWENKGEGKEFIEYIIDNGFDGPRSAHATDLDNDGDIDILAAARYSHQIALWDNDGDQNFTKNIIDDGFEGATNVFSTDIDQDGNKDILAAAVYANKVAWWQNKGNGQFARFIIGENFKGATFVYAEDIDADGYKDILVPAVFDNQIGLWISKPMHTPTGTFVSPVVERLENLELENISWQGQIPNQTRLRLQIRSADSAEELETASWHGPHSTEDFYTVSGSPINPLHNAHAILQYRVFFETDSLLTTPRLNQVIIRYKHKN